VQPGNNGGDRSRHPRCYTGHEGLEKENNRRVKKRRELTQGLLGNYPLERANVGRRGTEEWK